MRSDAVKKGIAQAPQRSLMRALGLTEEEAIIMFYKRTVAASRMPFGDAAAEPKKKKKMRMNERMAEWDAF